MVIRANQVLFGENPEIGAPSTLKPFQRSRTTAWASLHAGSPIPGNLQ